MPAAAKNDFDAERFAALWASFDTGNPSEAEAINAGRLLRRSLVSNGLRLVDVMGRADVRQALDVRLKPVRHENAELIEARKKAEEWRDEVTQRMQQVRQLADLLAAEKALTANLRHQIQTGKQQPQSQKPQPAARNICYAGGNLVPLYGSWGGVVAVLATVMAGVLLIASAFSGARASEAAAVVTPPPRPQHEILKGAKRHGLAKTQGRRGALVRKNRRVLLPAKPADVSGGVHRRE